MWERKLARTINLDMISSLLKAAETDLGNKLNHFVDKYAVIMLILKIYRL
jgi:hypothetical protein